jgi:hypothetical protein
MPSHPPGPVQTALRSTVHDGDQLATPARGAPFIVDRIDSDGVVLLLGKQRAVTRFSWGCLEGLPEYVRGKGSVPIGSKYATDADPGTLDAYLKGHVNRATAGWVAALLERAGVFEIKRDRPASVRLSPTFRDARRG